MKTSLANFFTYSSVALLALASCNKNDIKATTNGGTPGTLSASSTNIVLDKTKATDTTTAAISFTSTAPVYGFKAAVTTTLQVDTIGDNWKNPSSYSLAANTYNMSFTTPVFNSLLLKLKLHGGTASQVNVRLAFSLSPTVVSYSNVLSLTVTPFNITSWLYVVGSYQGWNLNNRDSLISVASNGIYTGIIDFTTGNPDFLVLPDKSDYNNKYATNDPKGTTSSTVTQNANNNFYSPATAGYYIVTLNLNSNTISFTTADYYSVTGNEVVGGDWGVDEFMKFVNDGSNNWVTTLNMAPVTNGGFKIRQDAQWSNSWGFLPTPDGKTLTNATGSNGATNMTVSAAGTYTITFTMAPSAYGTNPVGKTPTLAPYTLVKQ